MHTAERKIRLDDSYAKYQERKNKQVEEMKRI